MSLDVRRDNEAALAWLDGALRYAIARGQLALIACLESVLEDLVLEVDLDAPPAPLFTPS